MIVGEGQVPIAKLKATDALKPASVLNTQQVEKGSSDTTDHMDWTLWTLDGG